MFATLPKILRLSQRMNLNLNQGHLLIMMGSVMSGLQPIYHSGGDLMLESGRDHNFHSIF